jgi:predicted outer membrane repeat protein
VIQIEFFRLKFVRVSHLVQTVIVRGGLTTTNWDTGGSALTWGADKFASSDAEPVDIKIDETSIKTGGSLPAAHSKYTAVTSFPPQKEVSLSVTPKPGQNVTVSLNGGAPAGGGTHSLTMAQTNSIVIAVTAQDGVATQTYTVSYTYYYNSWLLYVDKGGSDNGTGSTGYPYKTVTKALEKIREIYNSGSDWPGGKTNPVAVRINISGEITDAIEIKETGNRYDTLPPIILTGSGTDTNEIIAKGSSRPLAITKATVILGDGLTLTGGNKDNGGGVYVTSGSFTMNGGTISGNTATTGGGVYVTGANSAFTMAGGTISGNTTTSNGGGVYVESGSFTMNGGTIGGSGADKNTASTSGGGVYINDGNFIMSGGTISGNTLTGSGLTNGGGVYVKSGSFTINGGSVGGNTAKNGGGVYLASNSGGNGGQFIMRGGSVSGNTATGTGTVQGGGVYVASSGTDKGFTMEGGAISGNTAPTGGGVYAATTGKFKMSGGSVSGNTATGTGGGGVYVAGAGTYEFTMKGGAISGTTATGTGGGGVYVATSGKFNMTEGSVSGNTAAGTGGGVYAGGTFSMSGGSISGNTTTGTGGGGVHVTGGAFTMSGQSSISENEAKNYGGGVFVSSGSFEMKGGSVGGNRATQGGGVYAGGTFSMQGGAVINQDNDVWLAADKTINIQSALTGTPTVARITPSSYSSDIEVLAGDFASYVDKFTVTPEGTINWTIGSDGKLLRPTTPTIGTY